MQIHAPPYALGYVDFFGYFRSNPLQQTSKLLVLSSVSHSSKLSNLRRLWECPGLQPQPIGREHGGLSLTVKQ